MRTRILMAVGVVAAAVVVGVIGYFVFLPNYAKPQIQQPTVTKPKKVYDDMGVLISNPHRDFKYWEGDMPQLGFCGKLEDGRRVEIRYFHNEDAKCLDLSFKLKVGDKAYPFRGKLNEGSNVMTGEGLKLNFGYVDNEEYYPRHARGYFVIDGKQLSVELIGLGSSAWKELWEEELKKNKLD